IGFLDASAAVEAARKVGSTSGTFKQTTVQAAPAVKEAPASQKPESHGERITEKAVELEVAEAVEMAPSGCSCQHAKTHVENQETQAVNGEQVEGAEDAKVVPKTFDRSAPPKDVADALSANNWKLALSLAIRAGLRDENELTNLIFFAKHKE